MAYNQGPQRGYEGAPARRPVPQRQYPPSDSQHYPQQGQGGGYDQQYAQGDYGYDQGGGYAPQQQGYDQYQQQQPPSGRGGYPPQQQYGGGPGYGARGGEPRAPAPGRGRPQDPYAQQQQGAPPPRGDSRGGYGAPPRGDSRGYPNGQIPPARGPEPGRPPMSRAANSVPGMQHQTRAGSLKSTYPQDTYRNNSFPNIPRRNPSHPGNYDLTNQFGNIDINAQPLDDRARSMEGQYAPRTFSLGSGPGSNVRGASPGYNGGHPQQHQRQQQQQQGYQEPPHLPNSGYAADGYSENIAATGPPLPAALLPAAGAYAPPRPQPAPGQHDPGYNDGYANDGYNAAPADRGHKKEDSVGDVYDAYFGDDDGTQAPTPVEEPRSESADRSRAGFQGNNANKWDQNQNPYGAPPPQRGPPQQQGGYAPQEQYDPGPAGFGPPQRSATSLDPGPGGFAPPQRSATSLDPGPGGFAPPQRSATGLDPAMGGFGPPRRSATALDPAMGGFGPPQRSFTSQDVTMGGCGLPPRSATASISSLSKGPAMGLPAHPAPYRPGLQQIPNGNHMPMTNKPPPIRNYQGGPVMDAPARISTPQPPPAPSGPAAQKKEAPVTSVTTQEIDQLRIRTNSNPNDQASTLLLARKLVLAAETLTASIPEPKQRSKTREKWIMEAHKLLKKLVAMNNTDAMFYLADCYGRGALGLETSPAQAFSLYQSAAKAGHAAAAYRTAVCCEIGQDDGGGTRKDPLKAMQWYKRAATLGDTPAMYKMGMIMLKGLLGQKGDSREAVMWLKRAAERADAENPHALHELALLYSAPQSSEGSVMRDEGYSFELFRQAAELGYKFSQFKMGCAFEFGLFNLPISPKESIQWYSKAAVQEEHQSELALSGWYLTGAKDDRTGGTILAQSDTEAYLWARKAAVAGLAKAEYAMGYFMETGIGCVKDLDGAKRWYWRAAAQNFPKARERLEELKRNGGSDGGNPQHQRISRSKVNKNSEAECLVM